MSVAEPIARAMSALHRVEASAGQAVREAGPVALDAVRGALGMLQAQTVNHPSVDAALEAVAGSLGLVHNLVKVTSAPPPAQPALVQAPPVALPQPAVAPGAAFAATALASAPSGFGVTAPIIPTASQQPMAAPPQPMMSPQQPMMSPQVDATFASAGVPRPMFGNAPGPDSAFAPNSTLQSRGAERPPSGAPPAAGGAPYAAETQPEAKPLPAPAPGQLRLEAALGAHSPTNFYKGLSGNDVVDAGGIFVATYQIPRIGTPLVLKVSLPGGYEFEAQAVVRWTREPASVSDGSQPGFGAQFTVISPEGRQLVYRYVRNREPLFHDDL